MVVLIHIPYGVNNIPFNHVIDTDYLQRCLSVLKIKPVFTLDNEIFRLLRSYSTTIATQRESGIFSHYSNTGILVLQAMLVDIFRSVIIPDNIIRESDGRSRPEVIYQQFLNLLLSTSVKPHEMEAYASTALSFKRGHSFPERPFCL